MKKIYLCVLALSVGSLSFAQQINDKAFTKPSLQPSLSNGTTSTIGSTTANFKAPGDTIFSEDFTNGLPAGWTTVDNTNSGFEWVLQPPGTLPDAAFSIDVTTIASTSGGNSMLLYSDLYNTPTPPSGAPDMDSYFQTTGIPVNNLSGVSVNFQQKFRRCCSIFPSPEVVLSVDTNSTFSTAIEYDIIGGVGGNIISADPMFMSINISAIAANYTGDIYLRFHVKSGTRRYYWFIDDIQIVESDLNDVTVTSGSAHFYGVEYTRIPVSQIQPMGVSLIYNNIGSNDQTNSNLTISIDDNAGNVVTFDTPNQDILSLESDTLAWDSLWTPGTTIGTVYSVTIDINTDDLTDISPANNEITLPNFEMTNSIMALDDYSLTPGSTGSGANNGDEYEAGNQFDCTANADLYSINVVTGDGTPITNTFIDVVLYLVDFSSGAAVYSELWRSLGYEITAADINTEKEFFDVQGTPIYNMISGETYVAAVHSYIDYEYATSGVGPNPGTPTATHSLVNYPNFTSPNAGSTFSLTSTPMIRLRLDIPTSVDAGFVATNFTVYPNPSTGEFTINLDGEAKTAAISVKNVVGQTIINKTVNVAGKTTETISLSDYSKGVYFLTVNEETVKLIVE